MSREATQELQDQLTRRIDYCRDEFDMTWAEILGVLEVIKSNLMHEARGAKKRGE